MERIHSTQYYTFFQSDKERCFYIDLGQKVVRLSFCQLLALRQRIWSINIENHFDEDINPHGLEILALCNREHLFVLNTLEVLDLKELLTGAFFLLDIAAQTPSLSPRV
ncbi:hypothetical protein D9O36_00155 [Zobellia amurskyensis]|uniref:Uncharacterized protein n=1 Tax=Zobellia amurskyensis TaxID=248905 RepID=A0A7X2ZPZ7_9FLAO|nr:hypothetical protein [Zobellia amurskyensis]MUH34243.1 hypothetical protein [Zobellia amurskyensis]